jgi:hypothetical protein
MIGWLSKKCIKCIFAQPTNHFDCQRNFSAAISDFLSAQRYQITSVHLKGAIWMSLGHAQGKSNEKIAEKFIRRDTDKFYHHMVDNSRQIAL